MNNPGRQSRARDIGLLALLVILSHTPFLGRPFHIDDRIYLEIARQAARTPLYPQDYRAVFEGKHGLDAASHSHPPLISYVLAFLTRLSGGENALFFHAVFLIFPVLLAAGVYLLALDRTQFPVLSALLVVWNPAFYVSAQSVMTDVPFVALYTLGLAFFVLGPERRWPGWRGLAAVFLSLAAMVNYLALSALPLVLVVQYWKRSQAGDFHQSSTAATKTGEKCSLVSSLVSVWPLVIFPLLTTAGWVGLQSLHYGRFILGATAQFIQAEGSGLRFPVAENVLSALLNVGGMMLAVSLFGMRRSKDWLVWMLLASTGALSAYLLAHWHWAHCLLAGVFAAAGVIVVKDCCQGCRQFVGSGRRAVDSAQWAVGGERLRKLTDLLLPLWGGGFVVICMFVYYHGAVRYVLPLIVAGILLTVSRPVWSRRRMVLCVAVSMFQALLLAHADYQFASLYPPVARQTFRDYPGRRVWATGEWGFRYYMEQQGAQTMAREDQRPERDDLLVKPVLAMSYLTGYDDNEHVELLARKDIFLSNPVRLLDFASHAGFYSTGWGVLPWSLQVERQPVEIFNFFRVVKQFEGDPSRLREDYFR